MIIASGIERSAIYLLTNVNHVDGKAVLPYDYQTAALAIVKQATDYIIVISRYLNMSCIFLWFNVFVYIYNYELGTNFNSTKSYRYIFYRYITHLSHHRATFAYFAITIKNLR